MILTLEEGVAFFRLDQQLKSSICADLGGFELNACERKIHLDFTRVGAPAFSKLEP